MEPVQRMPYKSFCDTSADEPELRLNRYVSFDPFGHDCKECNAWGGFGFVSDTNPARPGVWYCGRHRQVGQERLPAARGPGATRPLRGLPEPTAWSLPCG